MVKISIIAPVKSDIESRTWCGHCGHVDIGKEIYIVKIGKNNVYLCRECLIKLNQTLFSLISGDGGVNIKTTFMLYVIDAGNKKNIESSCNECGHTRRKGMKIVLIDRGIYANITICIKCAMKLHATTNSILKFMWRKLPE